jgi:hypothetical protein
MPEMIWCAIWQWPSWGGMGISEDNIARGIVIKVPCARGLERYG